MAIPATRASLTLRDSEGHESVMTFYSGDDYTTTNGRIATLKSLIENVSDAIVVRAEVTGQDTAPLTDVPTGDVDVELKARFGLYNADSTVSTLSIPGFDRSKLVVNTDDVDQEDTDISALVTELTSGNWTDSRGAAFVSLKYAKEAYSGRRGN